MKKIIGIRRESKYPTERRAPLTPEQVRDLIHIYDLNVMVQPCQKRIFKNQEYEQAGAIISEDLSECNVIFGIKEIPVNDLLPGKPFCFFSHTVKGQRHNMPMLRRILDLKDTLIDYELVTNEKGKRVIFFGNYAGYAGMIDSLWVLGQRLLWEGINNPFKDIKRANKYGSLDEAKDAIKNVGENIRQLGIPKTLVPFICGFSGYGQVSKGAQAIYDLLPAEKIPAQEFFDFLSAGQFSNKTLYKVEFTKPDLYERIGDGENETKFDLEEFQNHPERYKGSLENFIPHLTLFINGIFWEPSMPRLITKDFLKSFYTGEAQPRLRVIGDITCDVDGSIEATVKTASSKNPVYVYEPLSGQTIDGWEGNGPVIMAVDKLPSELPVEATREFGHSLMPFIPKLANIDFSLPLEELGLPRQFQNAVIVHQGRLTPQYEYLRANLR